MRHMGTNVFIGIFSISTIVALMIPLEAPANSLIASSSLRMSAEDPGLSFAVASPSAGSSASLSSTINLDSKAKILTYEDESLLLASMKIPAEPEKDKAVYASAKTSTEKVAGITATYQPAADASNSGTLTVTEPAIEEHRIDNPEYALNADVLFNLVNEYRVSIGLPAVQRDERLMEVGRSRAPEVFDEVFVNGNMHAGFHARNLPYRANEIIIHIRSEQNALNWWLNSPVHRSIIQGDYQYAGIGCDGKGCAMIFSNFEPKIVPVVTEAVVPSITE